MMLAVALILLLTLSTSPAHVFANRVLPNSNQGDDTSVPATVADASEKALLTGAGNDQLTNSAEHEQLHRSPIPDSAQLSVNTNKAVTIDKKVSNDFSDVIGNIYWSVRVEHERPAGFSDDMLATWRHQLESTPVSELTNDCGRMQNRLVTLVDGSQLCARYRINNDQIQGEVYTFYLARALGIDNVPPAILARADVNTVQWQQVAQQLKLAQWSPHKLLVLTPFVPDMRAVYIPVELRDDKTRNLAPDTPSLVNYSLSQLADLAQWSDLILLDYLTANVDRVVNNMFNLQWSAAMMTAPTHNLERAGAAGPLVFLDNESGLLHSYRLLDKYGHYHDKLLSALCLFRKSTADAIKKYHKTGDLLRRIQELFQESEPLADQLAPLPQTSVHLLNQRLAAVHRQIVHCGHLYSHR